MRWKRARNSAQAVRLLIAFLLLLAGGAIVNVAVAWGLLWLRGEHVELSHTARYAFDPVVSDRDQRRIERSFHILPSSERFVEVEQCRPIFAMIGTDFGIRYLTGHVSVFDAACRTQLEIWNVTRVGTQHPPGPHRLIYQRIDAGWPVLAMSGEIWTVTHIVGPELRDFVGYQAAVAALEVPRRNQNFLVVREGITVEPLPIRPLWSGFIINTLFYALLLWLVFFAPSAARRMIRRKRGQCEKCAYPVGVSPVCTECGAAVRASHPRSD